MWKVRKKVSDREISSIASYMNCSSLQARVNCAYCYSQITFFMTMLLESEKEERRNKNIEKLEIR